MDRNKADYYSMDDIINKMKSFSHHLIKRWWLILLFALIGAIIGVVYFNLQKPKYEAISTFILEEKQSGMGGLSSIASQFGFDVGGLTGGGSLFAGDNILDILVSKKVVIEVL
ncbi:MAG TPA: Wzz/FepE/Etk N-terminal domain-containing protein, partial [Flavisolibacter sp.]|nr:Wzz/FepE/Etk N-terminal domain-containing protein [Flavisolibacter sp.]